MGTIPTRLRISEALFAPARRRVLALFYTNADRRYHVREVIRQAAVGTGSVQNELRRLLAGGLLVKQCEGRQVYYQAARGSPVFTELRSLLVKTEGVPVLLESALQPLSDRIRAAFIYGSFARGEETSSSDIDVLIIGQIKLDDVARVLSPVQDTLNREVNPSIVTPDQFRKRMKARDGFLLRVMEGIKILIAGDANVAEDLG